MRRNLLFLFMVGVLLAGSAMFGIAADKGPWQASKGTLPEVSTPVGYTDDGAPVYLARVMKGGAPVLGWFTPSMGKAQILDGPRTMAAQAFDVWSGAGRWVAADASSLPPDALSAGKGADGRPVLLARVSYQGWLVPAAFDWQEESAVADIAGTRMSFSTFEVLVPDWTNVKNAGSMPVFLAGKDSDGSDLAPLRAPKERAFTPASGRPAAARATSRTAARRSSWASRGTRFSSAPEPGCGPRAGISPSARSRQALTMTAAPCT
jgi:hypothetical protein